MPDALLDGKYQIDRVIGRGAMGIVVAARHVDLDEPVAIKFLHSTIARPELVSRFLREGRAAVKIKSEHVARVRDVGRLPGGAPYIVMEYLEGRDLEAILRDDGALPVETATLFLLQACEALAEAHALGIVHRDVKPANIFLIRYTDGSPCIKVLDFGISKFVGGESGGILSQTQGVVGSPLYMSPEQLACSRDVDARTDVWSLGLLFYEMLTGLHPFMAESFPELVARVMSTPHQPIREIRPELPERLSQIIDGCLEKSRDRRTGSVAELVSALLPFAGSAGRISLERVSRTMGDRRGTPLPVAIESLPPPADSPLRASSDTARPLSRSAGALAPLGDSRGARPDRRWRGIVAVAVAIVSVGAIAWFAMPRASRQAPATTAQPDRPATPAPSGAVVGTDPPVARTGDENAAPAIPSVGSAPPSTFPPIPRPSTDPATGVRKSPPLGTVVAKGPKGSRGSGAGRPIAASGGSGPALPAPPPSTASNRCDHPPCHDVNP